MDKALRAIVKQCEEVSPENKKYRQFRHPMFEYYYFIKEGEIRAGKIFNESISFTDVRWIDDWKR